MATHSLYQSFSLLLLLFSMNFCSAIDKIFEAVGTAECADCNQHNVQSSLAFSGLRVTVDCKLKTGETKTFGAGDLDDRGGFKVQLPKELVQDGRSLKEECYTQLHNDGALPCPTNDGVEASKLVVGSETDQKTTFAPAKILQFSAALCSSKGLLPHLHPHPHHPWFHPVAEPIVPPPSPPSPPLPPYDNPNPNPNPPPTPINEPVPPVVKPLPPPAPIYEPVVNPLPPTVPIDEPEPKPPVVKPEPKTPVDEPKPKPPVDEPNPKSSNKPKPKPPHKSPPKPKSPVDEPNPPVDKPEPKPPVAKPVPPTEPVYSPPPPPYGPPSVAVKPLLNE